MNPEDHLLTESRNPRSEAIDTLTAREIVELMNAEDAAVVEAVRAEAGAIARAVEWTADRFRRGGRLIYVGAGTSGRLGCARRFGVSADVRHAARDGRRPDRRRADRTDAGRRGGRGRCRARGRGHRGIGGRSTCDLVVGIATSGRTPYVLGAVREARSKGAATVGIACNRPSLLGREVDLEIAPLVGPEIIAGSTRLKAGTATKMVLNMISTGAMVLIGKTLGNRMIDLQPTNEKLRIRSRRILRELAGVDDHRAAEILASCGGRLKLALVVALAGVEPEEAQALLDANGGQVRAAVEARDRSRPAMMRRTALSCSGSTAAGPRRSPSWRLPEGEPIGRGVAGPSNAKAVGAAAARQALEAAIAAAFADAGLVSRTGRRGLPGTRGLRPSRGQAAARRVGGGGEVGRAAPPGERRRPRGRGRHAGRLGRGRDRRHRARSPSRGRRMGGRVGPGGGGT